VRWKDLIGRARGASQALSLGLAEIPPGATLARHRHAAPEIYYVLVGAGSVEVDGQDYPAAAGSAIFIPAGATHAFTNTGAITIAFVYVFPVDAFADLVYMFDSA
jgi:quercetin dioxygenase-like cupin family protein